MTTAALVTAWADTAVDTVRGAVLTYAAIVATGLSAALLLYLLMNGGTPVPATDDHIDDDDEPFDRHDLDCAVWTTLCGGCTCGAA